MATLVVTAALRGEVPLSAGDRQIDAADVFGLVRQLELIHPGIGDYIQNRVSIAVDGVLVSDWSTRLAEESEVLFVPHIAGG